MRPLNLYGDISRVGFFQVMHATDRGQASTRRLGGEGASAGSDEYHRVPALPPELWEKMYRINFPITPAIAAGYERTVVVNSDGQVYTFGCGEDGQLGNGRDEDCNTAQRVELRGVEGQAIAVTAIAAGAFHTVILGEDKHIYTFGYGFSGQLGNGRTENCNTPQRIELRSVEGRPMAAKAIAAGAYHNVVLTRDGQVYTFGQGQYGQLGNGRNENCNTPQRVELRGVDGRPMAATAIVASSSHTVVLGVDGQVYTFGQGQYGRLGNGQNNWSNTPQRIELRGVEGRPITATAIAAGSCHTVVLGVDGQVYTFGHGKHGQLGNGRNENCNTPQQVQLRDVDGQPIAAKAIAAGFGHTVVLGVDGQVYTFGEGDCGQLGNGRYENCNTPQRIETRGVERLIFAEAIAAGSRHTVVLGTYGYVYTFGGGDRGQLGNGRNENCNTPQVVQVV